MLLRSVDAESASANTGSQPGERLFLACITDVVVQLEPKQPIEILTSEGDHRRIQCKG